MNDVPALLFAPGTWLFLDGGTLDLGLVRAPTLNATNDAEAFSELFEAVAMQGTESLYLSMPDAHRPTTSMPVTLSPCSSGS